LKVLGIAGSPRYGSNTGILLEEALNGAKDKGAETKLIHVAELNMMDCSHCDACLRIGRCPFQDDALKTFNEVNQSDIVIVAAPLHFMGIPSQLKKLVDRAQSYWARKYVLKLPPLEDIRERKGFFISVAGRMTDNLFAGAGETMKTFFASLDIKYAGMLCYAGIDAFAAVNEHPDMKQAAFEAGVKLVVGDG